ncbi:hypothetical protein E5329_03765 [Petralouisia muris]|uniref:Uncharacterized protein n=1 Tax=Petralouisia muris TaxID=3032872 RepID=A0AC61S092_9FIRM|nr:hypothetical protein [Petralouisia muris]TGY97732.1 hypothetical protein E5329_03765 [Petralouisia muris]
MNHNNKYAIFCVIIMITLSMSACSAKQSEPQKSNGIIQENQVSDEGNTDGKPQDIGSPDVEYVDDEYAMSDNLLPFGSEIVYEDISYKVLNVEKTKKFGGRIRNNLNDLSFEGIDSEGNLKGNETYVFLKICFTNTSEKEKEIYRNQGVITGIAEDFQIFQLSADTVYIDQFWNGGDESSVQHYVLKPGESVESEVGYLLQDADVQGKLYYMIGDTSEYDDIDNKFVALEE